jgi:hypothetical protein
MSGPKTSPDRLRVITTVAQHAVGTMARSSSLSLQEWDGINQCEGLLRVIAIGPGELDRQRNSASIANQMTLAAELSPIGGIGTRPQPPKTARTELPSTTARDQSICPQRANQSRTTKWISCQIPASCQSRKRRQQVIPEPHRSSCGTISQGIPLRNTNRMPLRHALFAKRGLPPLGFAFAVGMKGSMSSHRRSGNNSAAIGGALLYSTDVPDHDTGCKENRGFVRST